MSQSLLKNMQNFKLSGVITQKVSRGDNSKYVGAQQLMLGNIPVKTLGIIVVELLAPQSLS